MNKKGDHTSKRASLKFKWILILITQSQTPATTDLNMFFKGFLGSIEQYYFDCRMLFANHFTS